MLISKFDTSDIQNKISVFEEQLQIKLPKNYRKFMEMYNGGLTIKTKFNINKVSSDVRAFYGIDIINKHYNFNNIIQNKLIFDYLVDGMLLIGENAFGDYIVIGVNEDEKYGSVYFIYHDRKKKYVLLSDDFIEFVNKCKSERIGHIRTIEERKQLLKERGKEITDGKIALWQAEIDKYANIHQEEVNM